MFRSIFFLLFPWLLVAGPFWTPLPNVTTGLDTTVIDISSSPNGNLIAIWASANGQIESSTFNPSTETWSSPVIVRAASAETITQLAIAINDQGFAAAAWVNSTTDHVESAYTTSVGNWGPVAVQSDLNDPFITGPSVVIDQNNVPFIAWTQRDMQPQPNTVDLRILTYTGGMWVTDQIFTNARSPYPGYVIGNPAGDVVAFWIGGGAVGAESFRVIFSSRVAGVWSPATILFDMFTTQVASAISSSDIDLLSSISGNATSFVSSDTQPTVALDWTSVPITFSLPMGASLGRLFIGRNSQGFATAVAQSSIGFSIDFLAVSLPPGATSWSSSDQITTSSLSSGGIALIVVDSSNESIVVWEDGTDVIYANRSGLGDWQGPFQLSASSGSPALTSTDVGLTYVAWVNGSGDFQVSRHSVFPDAPTNFSGQAVLDDYGVQSQLFHQLNWAAVDVAVSYSIYSDESLSNLLINTTGLSAQLHNRSFSEAYTYYLVALDSLGGVSSSISITIPSYE